MHIGLRIQRVMTQRGATPLALAMHCGVTQGAVSNWFATGRIRKDNLVKVADLLQVRTDDLISGAVGEIDSPPLPPKVRPEDWPPVADPPKPAESASVAYVAEMAAKLDKRRLKQLVTAVDMLAGPHGDAITISFSVAPHVAETSPAPAEAK